MILHEFVHRVVCLILTLSCLICRGGQAAEPLKLVIPPIDPNARVQVDYFYKLLQLVLQTTEAEDGAFTIAFYPGPISVERSVEELRQGKSINLIWLATNRKREQDLLPVRVSLIRELNNYRVFLIRSVDQAIFDKIQTADDLRKLSAGLGTQWPDAEIMRSHGFPVTTSISYNSLFPMLAARRFDYFPRGLYEVWNEETMHKPLGLSIEKNLMIYYDAPFYFFVNRQNAALAARLERGLKRAQADGSFDQLLLSIPGFKRGLQEQSNSQRKLFALDPLPGTRQ